MSISDKVAVVCGSTSGIGKATAILLAQRGCKLILLSRNEDKLKKTIDELTKISNVNHDHVATNFDDLSTFKKITNDFFTNYKGKIDILINNSSGPPMGELLHSSTSDFQLAFNRLLYTSHHLVKLITPFMINNDFGRIINITSTSVDRVIPGLGVSNTVRGAVTQWAKTLAIELGSYNITVNNVLPGYTKTSRLDELAKSKSLDKKISVDKIYNEWANNNSVKRIGQPEEIANAIIFLCEELSGYITGQNIIVDGGKLGI